LTVDDQHVSLSSGIPPLFSLLSSGQLIPPISTEIRIVSEFEDEQCTGPDNQRPLEAEEETKEETDVNHRVVSK